MVLLLVLTAVVLAFVVGACAAFALVGRPSVQPVAVAPPDAERFQAQLNDQVRDQLRVERDESVRALREQWEAERRQLALEREQALQATVDTVLAVAGDKLRSHTAQATHDLGMKGEAIDERVAGMNDELRRVRQLVTDLQKEKAEQHGQFVQGINEAIRASAALSDTAAALREALSNSRARGQWGERMADDVLRVAGLVEGINYRRQFTLPGGTRPDFTFLLPRGRHLHMDVKFPVDNYLRSLEAVTDAERGAFCAAFLKDVRARVRELTGRDYRDPATTVGYVLLFIPNESVYGFVHEHDPRLVDDALAERVVLCSPFSLFAVLGVVRQAVDDFLVERTSTEILECLAGFAGQWQQFSDRLDRLGAQFATAQRSYDELAGTRRRQLQKQLDRIDHLRHATTIDVDDPVAPADDVPGYDVPGYDVPGYDGGYDGRGREVPALPPPRAVGDDERAPPGPPTRVTRLRPLR